MTDLIEQVKQSLVLQSKCNQAFSNNLTQVSTSVMALAPVSENMQAAAKDVSAISEQTSTAIGIIRQATLTQDKSVQQLQKMSQSVLEVFEGQANQLTQFSQEMQVLQEVLTQGVTAFSDRLPQSVNQTLVQFDSALREGVADLIFYLKTQRNNG